MVDSLTIASGPQSPQACVNSMRAMLFRPRTAGKKCSAYSVATKWVHASPPTTDSVPVLWLVLAAVDTVRLAGAGLVWPEAPCTVVRTGCEGQCVAAPPSRPTANTSWAAPRVTDTCTPPAKADSCGVPAGQSKNTGTKKLGAGVWRLLLNEPSDIQRLLSSHIHMPCQALLPVIEGMRTPPTWLLLHRALDWYAAHL